MCFRTKLKTNVCVSNPGLNKSIKTHTFLNMPFIDSSNNRQIEQKLIALCVFGTKQNDPISIPYIVIKFSLSKAFCATLTTLLFDFVVYFNPLNMIKCCCTHIAIVVVRTQIVNVTSLCQ